MSPALLHAVTGAFRYSGRSIAQRLLDAGQRAITLTNSDPALSPFADRIPVHRLCFDDLARLSEALRGVDVLYNTYWVRYNHRDFSFAGAVENSRRLFAAAQQAGVRRVVHLSVTNPSEDSPYEYFRGKARVERALIESGLSYAILRPAIFFGHGDVLINNIAWALRRLPVFGLFGDGAYRLQPIYIEDLARLAVEVGAIEENVTLNAIGPETFRYRELVELLAAALGKRRLILPLPPGLAYALTAPLGRLLGDVIVTRAEIEALMADLLCVDAPPAVRPSVLSGVAATRFSEWAMANASSLGIGYAHDLKRRRGRSHTPMK